MNPLSPIPRGGPFVVLFVGVIFYVTFSMGSMIGVQTAMNESVDYNQIRDNISSIDDDVHENLSRDVGGGLAGDSAVALTTAWNTGAVTSALWGFDFGYAYPDLARPHAKASPFIAIGMVATPLVYLLNKLRRRFK